MMLKFLLDINESDRVARTHASVCEHFRVATFVNGRGAIGNGRGTAGGPSGNCWRIWESNVVSNQIRGL